MIRLLVSGATSTLADWRWKETGNRYLGQLYVPGQWNEPPAMGLVWAADNGCFHGLDEPLFLRHVQRCASWLGWTTKPLWVAAPDVVGSSTATLQQWPRWSLHIASVGLEPCFVLQDGMEDRQLPDARAFFVGGTTAWKESQAVASLCAEVKRRGYLLHMGRVNTLRRMRWAFEHGCDSVDGSGFSTWPDTRIPRALAWLAHLHEQPLLSLGVEP
jgi:hypothetical protein